MPVKKGGIPIPKIDQKECQPAIDWWKDNDKYWADVRSVWGELFDTGQNLTLKKKVNDEMLFQKLFALGDEVTAKRSHT